MATMVFTKERLVDSERSWVGDTGSSVMRREPASSDGGSGKSIGEGNLCCESTRCYLRGIFALSFPPLLTPFLPCPPLFSSFPFSSLLLFTILELVTCGLNSWVGSLAFFLFIFKSTGCLLLPEVLILVSLDGFELLWWPIYSVWSLGIDPSSEA